MVLRFVCDEMLKGLGRWLRAAGYDTVIAADGQTDRDLLALARREGRYLLSRDRLMLERRGSEGVVVLLQANDLPGCVEELTRQLNINWLLAPFSRCLLCNHKLAVITADEAPEVFGRVPDDVCASTDTVLFCSDCNKVYWNGGHVRRMRARLQRFAKGQWQ